MSGRRDGEMCQERPTSPCGRKATVFFWAEFVNPAPNDKFFDWQGRNHVVQMCARCAQDYVSGCKFATPYRYVQITPEEVQVFEVMGE